MTKQILLSLLNCSWQWGLLGGLTWLITRRTRRANSTMHLLWFLFLLSLPILFALNQFVPAISIGSTSSELTHVQPVNISALAAQTADLPEISFTESNMQTQSQTVTGSQFSFNWTTTNLILSVWAIGTFVMLIRVALGLYRIHRLRRTATVADGVYQAVCSRLTQKLNINRPVTICFSDQVVSPVSFGWLLPHILIPRNLNLEQFELVAAHELAHVQRLDWLTNLFSHFVGAVFFFHPIYHFLNRKLVHLRERICDDWVIQLTGARKNYAQCLLDMVQPKGHSIPLVLGLNEPSELESRINSILKNNRQLDLQPKRRLFVVAATLLLTCLPLLAMAQLVPLKTVELPLFAQTPQESEKAVEKVEKERGTQEKLADIKDQKEYKEDKSVETVELLKNLHIIWAEGVKLLKKKADTSQNMDRNDALSLLEQTSENLTKTIEELTTIRNNKPLNKKINTVQKMDGSDVRSHLEQAKEELVKVQKKLDAIMNGKLFNKKTNTFQKMYGSDVRSQLEQTRENLVEVHKQLDAILNDKRLNMKTDTSQKMDREQHQNQLQVRIADPKHFSTSDEKHVFSGPQPGEKLPPLNATSIRGAAKGKTFDFIAKAGGQPLVLLLQEESVVGLRGLSDMSRIVDKIANESKQELLMTVVFLGDDPAALKQITQQVPKNVLVGISPEGREGPGNYGLNRNVSQTVIIAKEGKVLYSFAFTQPMLHPNPYVLGAIGEAIGVKPAALEKWLNVKNPVIEIKNPTKGEKTGKMLLNGTFVLNGSVVKLDGTAVQFDELLTFLRNLSEEQASMLTIQAERDVSLKQMIKVMDIVKEAGIDKTGFGISRDED